MRLVMGAYLCRLDRVRKSVAQTVIIEDGAETLRVALGLCRAHDV